MTPAERQQKEAALAWQTLPTAMKKAMASKGITGKITVLQGSNKTEADIKEAGDNTLRVMGVKLGKGDKLVAALSNISGKSMTVRFTIK